MLRFCQTLRGMSNLTVIKPGGFCFRKTFMTSAVEQTSPSDISLLSFLVKQKTGSSAVIPDLSKLSTPQEKLNVLQSLAEKVDPVLLAADNDELYADIHQWTLYSLNTVEPGMNDLSAQKNFSKFLNDSLKSKQYLATTGHQASLADLVLYAHLHPFIAKMTAKRRFDLCNLVRWFDLIQHDSLLQSYHSVLPLVEIDLDYSASAAEVPAVSAAVPAVSDKVEDKKLKKQNAEKQEQPASDAAKKEKKKEKKEKSAKVPVAVPVELPINNPIRLDVRVGKIVGVKQHENADSLYVEQIDLGEPAGPRTVVSGLVKHIPIDQMHDRLVVVLCNLKPANMRGVKSEGMVLAATGKEGKVELLAPHTESVPGDRVYFEGFEYSGADDKPDAVLNSKKKVWETIQPGLFTDSSFNATYKKQPIEGEQAADPSVGSLHLMRTQKGLIKSQTVVEASIK